MPSSRQSSIAILATFALVLSHAQQSTTDQRCTANLASKNNGWALTVPQIVPSPNLSDRKSVQIFNAEFLITHIGNELQTQLTSLTASNEKPPFNCQTTELSINNVGGFEAKIPSIHFNGTRLSANLGQTSAGSPLTVTSISSETPTPPAPKITLSCQGVTHKNGFSLIRICFDLGNVSHGSRYNSVWQSNQNLASEWTETYPGDAKYGSFLTVGLTEGKVCQSYTIYSYGTYSGLYGISTAGGTAAINWEIKVDDREVRCP